MEKFAKKSGQLFGYNVLLPRRFLEVKKERVVWVPKISATTLLLLDEILKDPKGSIGSCALWC